MGKKGDTSGPSGEIKTIDIINITIKDMSKSKTEDGHAMIIDTGFSLFHLNFSRKFDLEKWREAIKCSMQTARESRLSITGNCKNICKLIHDF